MRAVLILLIFFGVCVFLLGCVSDVFAVSWMSLSGSLIVSGTSYVSVSVVLLSLVPAALTTLPSGGDSATLAPVLLTGVLSGTIKLPPL